MTSTEAIKILSCRDNRGLPITWQDGFVDAVDTAIEALKAQQWIPCSERLPKAGEYIGDVGKYYLVQNEYGDMLVARYTHGEYWEQIYQLKPIGDDIVAWMPLPEPMRLENES